MTDFNFTANQASKALGKDARTIQKRIEAANLKPVGTKNGGKIYPLSDIAQAVFSKETTAGGYDVSTLTPKQRKEHWDAEKRETEVALMRGDLIEVDKAAAKFAEMAKEFSDFFTTSVDNLEQSGQFTTEQLVILEKAFDEQRRIFADKEFS